MHSLVSEPNEPNASTSTHADVGTASSSACMSVSDIDVDNVSELGVLILAGVESEAEDDGSHRTREYPSRSLSVPDTLFLPTEIGSVGVGPLSVSCMTPTQGKDNSEAKESTFTNQNDGAVLRSFHAMIALMMILALVFTSWTSRVNKNEALRLQAELQQQQQKMLLPLALSLWKQRREVLRENQMLLEPEMERAEEKSVRRTTYPEKILAPVPSDEGALLSYKSCYIEASLSLGPCSRGWQKGWRMDASNSSSAQDAEEETPAVHYSQDSDEEFTEVMFKLITSFSNSIVAATKQSYALFESAVCDLSRERSPLSSAADAFMQSAAVS